MHECIVLLDFAENYKYVVQDEVQSFHWNNRQCTLHPVVLYFMDNSNLLQESSLCILSDDMDHDVSFVHEVQRFTAQHINETHPVVDTVHYYSDGCAKQYKNYKHFLNLCYHKDDFQLAVDQSFFATSHGKSACNGIGGTVKRLTARASLQRPISDQILTLDAMFNFCTENIPSIRFFKVTKEQILVVREHQEERFKEGTTVPGTRSYHYYEPVPHKMSVKYRTVNEDIEYCGEAVFQDIPVREKLQPMQFIACKYDGFWWIGLIQELDQELEDAQVKFMHPHGPTTSVYCPTRDDICWVPFSEILCSVQPPTTYSGRAYIIDPKDIQKINQVYQQQQRESVTYTFHFSHKRLQK